MGYGNGVLETTWQINEQNCKLKKTILMLALRCEIICTRYASTALLPIWSFRNRILDLVFQKFIKCFITLLEIQSISFQFVIALSFFRD